MAQFCNIEVSRVIAGRRPTNQPAHAGRSPGLTARIQQQGSAQLTGFTFRWQSVILRESCFNPVIVMKITLARRWTVAILAAALISSARAPADDVLVPILDNNVAEIGGGLVLAPQSISDDNFNYLAFGPGFDAATARLRFDELVEQRVAAIDRCCALTANQSAKLKLAGRGDVHRFFERVDDVRRRLHSPEKVPANLDDLRTWLQQQLRSNLLPFGEESLFAKALRTVLSGEQTARLAGNRLIPLPPRQQIAIRRIEKLGGRVVKRSGGPGWLRNQIGDEWTRTFDVIEQVDFRRTRIRDADLALLKELLSIPKLYLAETAVTDVGLANLQGLATLRYLVLDGTAVTDAGLLHLQKLTKLEFLSLYGTRVTDTGLLYLQELECLRELYLSGRRITSAGLDVVKPLSRLRVLSLYDTQVSDAAIADLQQVVPTLRIQELRPR
jgi:hypothetical protein